MTAVAACLAAGPVAWPQPAAADPTSVVVITTNCDLPNLPTNGAGEVATCGGGVPGLLPSSATGVGGAITCVVSCPYAFSNVVYSEACTVPIGSATGQLVILGQTKFFSWSSTGLVAVILVGDVPNPNSGTATGAGVGLLVPNSAPTTFCPGPDTIVSVAALAAWAS